MFVFYSMQQFQFYHVKPFLPNLPYLDMVQFKYKYFAEKKANYDVYINLKHLKYIKMTLQSPEAT